MSLPAVQPPFVDRLLKAVQAAQFGTRFADAIRGGAPRGAQVLQIGRGTSSGGLACRLLAARRFDLIFSSHHFEHQPDLLKHLVHLERLLAPGGVAVFLVPHHRHTVDAWRRPTSTSDVLLAHDGPPGLVAIQALQARFDAASHAVPLRQAFEQLQAGLCGESPASEARPRHVFSAASLRLLLVELYLLKRCTLLPCAVSGAVGHTFLIALTPIPRPQDPAECAHFEDWLQEQRAVLHGEVGAMAGSSEERRHPIHPPLRGHVRER